MTRASVPSSADILAFVHTSSLGSLLTLVLALEGEYRERAIPGSRELSTVARYTANIIREHSVSPAARFARNVASARQLPEEPT